MKNTVYPNQLNWLWRQDSLHFSGYLGSFPGLKLLEHEAALLNSILFGVKNEWSYTSVPPMPSW